MQPSPLHLTILLLALISSGCAANTADDTATTGTTTMSPCGLYSSAWRENAEWDWELDADYQASNGIEGGWKTVAQGSEDYAGYTVWIIQETASYSSSTWPEDGTQVEWRLACDSEGVKLVEFEGLYNRVNGSNIEEGWWSADFDEPPLLQPADMAVGDSWDIDTNYSYYSAGTTDAQMNLTASFTVSGQQTAEVNGQLVDAYQVDVEWSGDPRTSFAADSYSKFVAQDVGDIELVGRAKLVRWDPDPTFSQSN